MKHPLGTAGRAAALVLAVVLGAPVPAAADRDAAERQYRIARRLVAETSPAALEALEKVVELDPGGPLVDDALVEQALLLGIPRWPEEIGRLAPEATRRALALLDRVVGELGGSDRAGEARYLRGLARLEPNRWFEAESARIDLLAIAQRRDPDAWPTRAARYALGRLAENRGQDGTARAAYQRLLVEAPASEAATRARVGVARLDLRAGDAGAAAALLDRAVSDGAAPALLAPDLRQLAVGAVLRRAGRIPGFGPLGAPESIEVRGASALAVTHDGSVLVADRRTDEVRRVDPAGRVAMRWSLESPQALVVAPSGPAYAAAARAVHRLEDDGTVVRIAAAGSFDPVTSIAVDGLGRLWVLDRRGDRVGRLDPGAEEPVPVGEQGGMRLQGIVWDGRRVLGLDPRSKSLLAIADDGARSVARTPLLHRPIAIAADLTGRVAVLDARGATLMLLDPEGSPLGQSGYESAGIQRPGGVGFAADGTLHVVDEGGVRVGFR